MGGTYFERFIRADEDKHNILFPDKDCVNWDWETWQTKKEMLVELEKAVSEFIEMENQDLNLVKRIRLIKSKIDSLAKDVVERNGKY